MFCANLSHFSPVGLATAVLIASTAALLGCGDEGAASAKCWHRLDGNTGPSLIGQGFEVDGQYFGPTVQRSGAPGLAHFDGKRWQTIALISDENASGADAPKAVWASSAQSVVAVSEDRVLHWQDGSATVEVDRVPGLSFNAVWGFAKDDIWVAGYSVTLNCFDCNIPARVAFYHYDGRQWRDVSPGIDGSIAALWGAAPDDLWAAGSVLLHYDGRAWKKVDRFVDAGAVPARLWGEASDSIWLLAVSGEVRHYDGKSWRAIDKGDVQVVDVRGLPDGRVFAFGWNPANTLLQWNGRDAFEPAKVRLPEIAAGSRASLDSYDGKLLLVLGSAYQLQDDGFSTWLASSPGGALSATTVATNDPGAFLAVRERTLFALDGDQLAAVATLAGVDSGMTFYDLAAKSARDAWVGALGDASTRVYHWDGAELTTVTLPQDVELSFPQVALGHKGEPWIAGIELRAGVDKAEEPSGRVRVFRFDGESWQDESPDIDGVFAITLSVAGDSVWVAVDDGRVVARDGDSWVRRDVTKESVTALDAIGTDEAFAITTARGNDDGLIVRYEGDAWSKLAGVGHAVRYLDGSASDLWATTWPRGDEHALVMHFDGHTWDEIDASVLEDVPIPIALQHGRAVFVTDYGPWLYDCEDGAQTSR